MTFGPWSPAIDAVERRAQLRSLATLIAVYFSSSHPLIPILRRAEDDAEALVDAALAFDRLPSLKRRHLISTFGAVTWLRLVRRP